MLKTGQFSQREENKLRKVKDGPKAKQQLQIAAQKMNRDAVLVRLKWKRLLLTNPSAPALKRGRKPAAQNLINPTAPMEFEAIDYDPVMSRGVDPDVLSSMTRGLDDAIAKGNLSGPGKSILFPTNLVAKAKIYLAKEHSKFVFKFFAYKDKISKVLYRKS